MKKGNGRHPFFAPLFELPKMKEKGDKFSGVFHIVALISIVLALFVRYNLIFSFCEHKTLIEIGFIALTLFLFYLSEIKNKNRFIKLCSKAILLFSFFFIHIIILDLIQIVNHLLLQNSLIFLSCAIFFVSLFYLIYFARKEFFKKFDILSFSILFPLHFIYLMLLDTIIVIKSIF
ncbi:hypothetical protein KAU33_10545 [Candidatus Dependentiae bacterium]|nr:hypothetical protein [Candidatus Dependentiae bacterium]